MVRPKHILDLLQDANHVCSHVYLGRLMVTGWTRSRRTLRWRITIQSTVQVHDYVMDGHAFLMPLQDVV